MGSEQLRLENQSFQGAERWRKSCVLQARLAAAGCEATGCRKLLRKASCTEETGNFSRCHFDPCVACTAQHKAKCLLRMRGSRFQLAVPNTSKCTVHTATACLLHA